VIGQQFARLTVIAEAPRLHRKRRWVCSCSCGGTTIAFQWSLRAGRSRSCGCLKAEELNERQGNENHGMHRSPEYQTWLLMNRRCYDPGYRGFPAYGGSGIGVCDQWRASFSMFLRDMGRKPSPNYALTLISREREFEPGNCRWSVKAPGEKRRPGFARTNPDHSIDSASHVAHLQHRASKAPARPIRR
jgi:hypothetical protein